jgi:hypothetical protein
MVAYNAGCDSSHGLLQQLLHDQAAWASESCVQMMSVRPAMNNRMIALNTDIDQMSKYHFIVNLHMFCQK